MQNFLTTTAAPGAGLGSTVIMLVLMLAVFLQSKSVNSVSS